METVELDEAVSPFAGAGLAGGDVGPEGVEVFAGTPAVSPFAEALTTQDEQDRADREWFELVDELADEGFDEALADLTAEAARRYLRARSRTPLGMTGEDPARDEVQEWLGSQGQAVDAALERVEQGLAEGATITGARGELEELVQGVLGEAPTFLDAHAEQLFGGLVRKAFSAATSLARKGIAAVGKLLPIGRIFSLLRPLVQPLLRRVLNQAIGRLPAPLQGPARTLAAKLGVGEDEQPGPGETFDQQLAEALLATTDGQVDQLAEDRWNDEGEAFEGYAGEDPILRLDRARAALADQLATADPGRPPTEQLEQFIPAVMAAMPLIRTGLKLIGRDKVVRFVAGHLAPLIQPYIGPDATRALAPQIADTGLRMLSLEAEAPAVLGAQALVDTVEETVRSLSQLPDESLADPLRLEAATDTALAEAAGRLLPPAALRPDLETLEDEEGHWVLMPRRAPGCFRYRTWVRPLRVTLTRPMARAIVLSGEDTLEERLEEAGVSSWPVTGEVHLYEAMDGTHPGHLTAFEDPSSGVSAEELEQLTPATAAALLGRPGLGARVPMGGAAMVRGGRYFRLAIPGRVVRRRRRPRLVVRVDNAAAQPVLRLHLRLGERSSDVLAGHLTRTAYADAVAAIGRLLGPAPRQHLARRLAVRLGRALGAPVPPARAAALGDTLVEAALRALSGQLAGASAAVLAAIRDPAQGITLTFTSRFPDRAALLTGKPAEPTMTVRPGFHHD